MEDSFRVRVDKIFGSLGNETPLSDQSLWSLTDQEIERRHWNRPNKEQEQDEDDNDDDEQEDLEDEGVKSGVCDLGNQGESGLLQQLSESNHEEEEDEDGAEVIIKKNEGVVGVSTKRIVDEDWDIESNIGRDCTLDYEEEEDEYDKVAAGMEQSGDRLYMKDVKFGDYETHELNTYGELPTSYDSVVRDPRANHMAAKMRLKEDAEAAGNFDTLQLSDNSEVNFKACNVDDVDNPKPILKKRETDMDSRSQKRVRFMLDDCEEQQQPLGLANGLASDETSSCSKNEDVMPQKGSKHFYDVPDYVKNPSKYTHYTFDSSGDDMDDQSNQKAFAHQLRKREADNNTSNDDMPKSIVFTPKRKSEPKGCKENSEGDFKKKGWSVEDPQDAMEEDEPYLPPNKARKPGRQYRARTNSNNDDDLNLDVD